MEDLWLKAHVFVLECKIGDFYKVGDQTISCIKRTKNRIWFSNGSCFTIKKLSDGSMCFAGKNVDRDLRNIEGYFIYLKHINNFKVISIPF